VQRFLQPVVKWVDYRVLFHQHSPEVNVMMPNT